MGQTVLIPHQQDSLWGYVDLNSDQLIVPYQYEVAEEHDPYGYAMVQKNGYWGILNADGIEVLETKYDSLAWQGNTHYNIYKAPYLINQLNGSFGIMDLEFNAIIPNEYEAISFFHGTFFKKNPKEDYTKSERRSIPRYFRVKKNDKVGLVDEQHQLIVPFEYSDIKSVVHYKVDSDSDSEKNPYQILSNMHNDPLYDISLISKQIFFSEKDSLNQLITVGGKALTPIGNYKHPIIFTYISSDKEEDEMILISKDKKRGMISMEGDILIPFEYLQIEQLTGPYFKLTKSHTGNESQIHDYGIANIQGQILQAAIYAHLNGQLVHKDGKSGIFTKDFKKFLVEPQYDYISSIRKNHTKVIVHQNGKRGILDIEKGMVIPVEYDYLKEVYKLNYIAKRDDKFGIIDSNNNIILPIEYKYISLIPRSHNTFIVQKDKKYDLWFSRDKEWLTTVQYDSIYTTDFSKIHVQLNGKWGKINSANKILIPIEYDEISLTNQVRKGDKWGLYDRSNKLLLEPIYDEIKNEHYARIGSEWLLITETKNWPLSEKYDKIQSYSNRYYTEKNKKKGLIIIKDSSLYSIPAVYEQVSPSQSSDLVRVKKAGKWGLIDMNKTIIPIIYDRIEQLGNDRWKVYDGKHWAFYELNGKQILPFIFSDIKRNPHDGNYVIDGTKTLYLVKQGNRFGAISKNGEWIFPCKYQNIVLSFHNSNQIKNPPLFPVQQKRKWGYIRQNGEIVLPFQYSSVGPFYDNIAIASKGNGFFLINDSGDRITKNTYKHIVPLQGYYSLINVQNEAGLHGALNKKGEEVIPPIYDKALFPICQHFYKIVKNGLNGIVHSSGKIIMECKENTRPKYPSRQVFLKSTQVDNKLYKNYSLIKKDNHFGVKNIKTNTLVIPYEYKKISISYGKKPMAYLYATKDGFSGVIDSTGKIIIPFEYDQVSINQKMDRISCKKKSNYKIFNLKGQFIAEHALDHFNHNGDGPYRASKNGKWGFVDLDGNMVIPFQFDEVKYFRKVYSTGEEFFECPMLAKNNPLPIDTIKVATVEVGEIKKYINQKGAFIKPSPANMNRIYINSELIGVRQDSTKKYGIVDTAGNIVLPFEYKDLYYDSGHYVYLYKDDQDAYFYIANKTVSPLYEEVEDEGETYNTQWVSDGTYYGFVNKFGEAITPMHFDFVRRTGDGLVAVSKGGLVGFLNDDIEKEVIPFIFDAIPCSYGSYQFKQGNALALKNNKYGIINTKGEAIIPFEYDAIKEYDHYRALGLKNGEWKEIVINK